MPVSWEYRGRPGHHICIVKIDNRVVCTATAETKQAARDEAARQGRVGTCDVRKCTYIPTMYRVTICSVKTSR